MRKAQKYQKLEFTSYLRCKIYISAVTKLFCPYYKIQFEGSIIPSWFWKMCIAGVKQYMQWCKVSFSAINHVYKEMFFFFFSKYWFGKRICLRSNVPRLVCKRYSITCFPHILSWYDFFFSLCEISWQGFEEFNFFQEDGSDEKRLSKYLKGCSYWFVESWVK